MSDRLGIYVTFWAKPGKIDDLVATMCAAIASAEDEPGTLVYAFQRVSGELEGVSAYEIYADADALDAHMKSDAVATLRAALPDLLGAPPERHDFVPLPGAKGFRQ